jgi:proton glutamate symport protein
MDMARTSLNLLGNCFATVIMARWEGEGTLDGPLPGAAEGGVADVLAEAAMG